MKISDKTTWDRLIYGLIYPGFLGSMLYELVPTEKSQFTLAYFWTGFARTPENYIRCAILVFYFLDYIHLYGDMETALKRVENKSWDYFLCDFLTCCGYLVAFIALKVPNYAFTVAIFGLVPWLFLLYKRKNSADRKFFAVYGGLTFWVLLYRVYHWDDLPSEKSRCLALMIITMSVTFYGFYVWFYYERFSRSIDNKLYSKSPLFAQ